MDRDYRMDRRYRRKKSVTRMKLTRGMKISLFVGLVVFLLASIGMVARIIYINRVHGDDYKKQVLSQQSYYNKVLNYRRGAIMDRNGTILAQSIRKFNLVLEPRTLGEDPEHKTMVFNKIAMIFGADVTELEAVMTKYPDSMYQKIDSLKNIPTDKVELFKESMGESDNIPGVWFEETFVRQYPLDTIACNIVGFTSAEDSGTYGIEGSCNSQLTGTTGREYGYFDADMNYQQTVKKATNGNSVVLTIDANVQRVIEDMIQKKNKSLGAENIAVMVMNPNNGEILAMASQNKFDLNNPQNMEMTYSKEELSKMKKKEKSAAIMRMWQNYCVSTSYEPGSTFKPFTVAAGLEEGACSPSNYYNCPGSMTIANQQIHCANRSGHGVVSLEKSLNESCNCAMMQIVQKLGVKKFHKYTNIFGFGEMTGVDVPGEASGYCHSLERFGPVELATSSFGQTQTVTMVQMAAAFSSVVNGGNYYQPHVVKEIQNESGVKVEGREAELIRKTVSESTSRKLRKYLKSTVEVGTAKPAGVVGYEVGGKTGTAQMHDRHGTVRGKYLVSFLGCVPADKPEAVIYVIIDRPHVEDQAHSTYATEFASKIMKKILPFIGLYASDKVGPKETSAPEDTKQDEVNQSGDNDNQDEANQSGDE